MTPSKSKSGSVSTGLKLTALIGVAIVTLGGAAWAGGGKWHGAMFDHLDANKDQQVNKQEFAPFADKRFTKLDADADGIVTTAEIDAHLQKRLERHRDRLLKRFDGDGDGKVTRSEFDTHMGQMFDRVDKDDDGSVSRAEADEMRKHMRAKWKRHMDHDAEDQTQEN